MRGDEMQAQFIELTDLRFRELLVAVARLAGDKKAKVGAPLRIDDPARPGSKPRKRKVTMAEAFGRIPTGRR